MSSRLLMQARPWLLSVVAVTGLVAQPVLASGGGAWTDTGPLKIARSGYVINRLPDGRVLIAGGIGGGASAEIYDPSSRSWTRTADMTAARSRSASVALADGRILVAGGRNQGLSLASAEIFDPASRTWSLTGSMSTPRDWLALTRLADGRVLAAGGLDLDGTRANPVLQSSEIYDPATGLWTTAGEMSTKRWGFTITTLSDGRVLAAGGANAGSECEFSPTYDLFDPATGVWTNAGDMRVHRGFYRSITAPDGRVLFLGGEIAAPGNQCATTTASVEAFDPVTNSFSSLGSLVLGRSNQAVALVPDGRVLVAGGSHEMSGRFAPTSTAEIYDPASGTAVSASLMATARSQILGVTLTDGSVLVPGGAIPGSQQLSVSSTFAE
jgi:N-acetylneuraminic acid mutarotase